MGIANKDLILTAEKLKKELGINSPEYLAAEKAVNKSQKECKHNGKKSIMILQRDSKTGKYKEGDEVEWCLLCALPLKKNGMPL